MRRQQQTYSHFSKSQVHGLSHSMVSSFYQPLAGYEVRLPPISQSFISRYRSQKLKTDFYANKGFSTNIFTQFFCGKQNDSSVSMCDKCERSKERNLCSFMLNLIEQKYDWRNDIKFRSTYEFYNKKRINVFLTQEEIENRLISKFNILGVILLENHKMLLTRIIKNYIKHTIYYGEEKKLTLENDYYFWFLIGIYYHVGVPKFFNQLQYLPKESIGLYQPMMFWMLDVVMKRLADCTQEKIRKTSQTTLQYCKFFYQRQCRCLSQYDINLYEIFYEWTNEGMMGYMGIEFIGFYIKSILKQGFEYMQKTIMSYFEKRVIKLDKDEIISFHHEHIQFTGSNSSVGQNRRNKKEQIMKVLLDSNEEWPGIFYSTNVYDLKGG